MAENSLLEVEVKFFLPTVEPFRQKLCDLGALLSKERVYERNLILDTADRHLFQAEKLLRLRQDTAVRLTFKGKSSLDADSEAKVREEIEMEAGDFDTAVLLFNRLGYQPQMVYEKYRETYRLGDAEIVLDEMPYGDFIEIEGDAASIKSVAGRLGLDWNGRLQTNYLALMHRLKEHHHLPFTDLTFANFIDLNISIADVLEQPAA